MRRDLRKRIFVFSGVATFVFIILVIVMFFTLVVFPAYKGSEEKNLGVFQRIHCKDSVCDNRDLINDSDFESPDYILTKDKFFIQNENIEGFWLNFSDPSYLKRFETLDTITTPAGETWELYSKISSIDGKQVGVMAGWRDNASYFLQATPLSLKGEQRLKEEVERIFNQLKVEKGEIVTLSILSDVDSYQIVDVANGKIIRWTGDGVPAYLPVNISIRGEPFFIDSKGGVSLVKIDTNTDLTSITLAKVGNIKNFVVGFIFISVFLFLIFYISGTTLLKKYFLFLRKSSPLVYQALKIGEGQEIEFKQGMVDDVLLDSIDAFANTNDGTIFVGIDDRGKITGLDCRSVKDKDYFIHHVFTLIKNRIKPMLSIQITFEEIRGFVVAKIFIPRGEEPLYYMDGIIYIRHGDSDIKAAPELIKKILAEYLF